MDLRYFKLSEFDDPREAGSGQNMQEDFLEMLDELRHRCGFPFRISSGFRIDAGVGSPRSQHLFGRAVDIATKNGIEKRTIVKHAIDMGFNGIGVYNGHVHVDNRASAPVIWSGVSQ